MYIVNKFVLVMSILKIVNIEVKLAFPYKDRINELYNSLDLNKKMFFH